MRLKMSQKAGWVLPLREDLPSTTEPILFDSIEVKPNPTNSPKGFFRFSLFDLNHVPHRDGDTQVNKWDFKNISLGIYTVLF